MIVVADTTPVSYLVLIGVVRVLQPLYGRVLVPETVIQELRHPISPATMRAWLANPPLWMEIRPDPPPDPTLSLLDAGERMAIALARIVKADRVLMDDWDGRAEAERLRLRVTGTLGVLAEAHLAGLLVLK